VSKWAGKYVIGLTGNIGTGKSVVRRMLEHLGGYGIDADALAHRTIAKGSPGYQPVLTLFGQYVLGTNREIDRKKLGRVVFTDPGALDQLEEIIHPLVEQGIDFLIRRASQPVVAIEAIKLLETKLRMHCDSVWVVTAPPEAQLARLVQRRQMSEDDARQRMAMQQPQAQKEAAANVIIRNQTSFEDTWKQVVAAWRKEIPGALIAPTRPLQSTKPVGRFQVFRGRPSHSNEIAALLNRLQDNGQPLSANDIMAAFGEKAYLMLQFDQKLKGLIGWQVENLVARATDMIIDPGTPVTEALVSLIVEMERASQDLQCEAALVFVKPGLARHERLWEDLGYQRMKVDELEVLAWQEAARESMPPGSVLLFKKLRQERILRPI